jgi:hypothetical protein
LSQGGRQEDENSGGSECTVPHMLEMISQRCDLDRLRSDMAMTPAFLVMGRFDLLDKPSVTFV